MSPAQDDPRIDHLYSVSLSSFVAERNRLAKEIASEGDSETAQWVKSLQKPSVAAWVVNQIARRNGDLLDRIIKAGDELRETQRAALTGGDPDAVRDALSAERAVVAEAVTEARAIIVETGVAASAAQLDRIADTFLALASNDEAREQVRRGRLTREVQRVGFGDFAVPEDALVTPDTSREDARRAERERETLREKAQRARERAERLEREARDLRERADQAERTAREAADDAVDLARRLEEA